MRRTALPPGATLGSYRILSQLGQGAMADVYLAEDARSSMTVALKVLPAELRFIDERLLRFQREARAVSASRHPNVIEVYEVGAIANVPYIAMEHIDGRTLRELLDAGPRPVRAVFDIASQIVRGLARIHASGIVHRDLKPENVMITRAGRVKILDFGLSKSLSSRSGDLLTLPGTILGTLHYLSPEQSRGQTTDFRADQFAFGAILYEMATGVVPFRRKSIPETLSAIARGEPVPPRALQPDCPGALAGVIERCLAKLPADRYATTNDLKRALRTARWRWSWSLDGLRSFLFSTESGRGPREPHPPYLSAR